MKDSNKTAHFLLLVTAIIYGALFCVGKIAMQALPHDFITLLRIAVATLFFGAIWSIKGQERPILRHICWFLLGGLSCALFNTAYFSGLEATSPINAAIIMSCSPIVTSLLGVLFLKEKISRWQIGWTAFALTALIALLLQKGSIHFSSFKGDALMLLCCLSFSIYLICLRRLNTFYKPITNLTLIFGLALLLTLPFSFGNWEAVFNPATWTPTVIASLVFIVIVATVIVHYLNTLALETLTVSTASRYGFLYPVFATFFALILGLEEWSFTNFLLGVTVLFAVFMANTKPWSMDKTIIPQ